MPLTVLCDVDDVVADLVPAWLKRYNRDYQDIVSPDDLKSWAMPDWVSEHCGEAIYDYLKDPTLYDEVAVTPGAFDGINFIRSLGHRVVFVTSASGAGMGAKLRWLIQHDLLPSHSYIHPDFIVAHDKALIRGDVLIDDRAANVEGFPGGRVLFDRPWNRAFRIYDHAALRMMGWRDIDHILSRLHREGRVAA